MANRFSEYFKLKKQDKEEFTAFLDDITRKISVAESEYVSIFRDPASYIDVQTVTAWKNKFSRLHDDATSYLEHGMIEKKKLPKTYMKPFSNIDSLYARIDKAREVHNQKATTGSKADAEAVFIQTVGMKPTEYQTEAILSLDKRLLISGAPSTGKTSALRAKMQYVKNVKHYDDDAILFLSGNDRQQFARLSQDLLNRCGDPVDYERPQIDILPKMIREFILEKTAEPSYRSRLIDYYLKFHVSGHTIFEFDSIEEYERYIEKYPPISLKGECLRSYEELDIANFLFALGVEYRYNAPFPEEIILKGQRTRYKPDFTLVDYKIALNIYQIDQEGNVSEVSAPPLSNPEQRTRQYWEYVTAVMTVHEEKEIPLIECFSHEKLSGNLLSKLQSKLSSLNVQFNIKSDEQLLEAIMTADSSFIEQLTESIRCSVETMLAADMTEESILTLSRSKSQTASYLYRRRERLMSLMLPFYKHYISKIPMDDYRIVTRAAKLLSDHKLRLDYRYLFVDDVENLNACNMKLILALCENSGCSIAAAGSRWCPVIGRYGSDPIYMLDFGRFFPGFFEIECTRLFDMPKGLFAKLHDCIVSDGGNVEYNPMPAAGMVSDMPNHIETVLIQYDNGSVLDEKIAETLRSIPDHHTVLLACRYDGDVLRFAHCATDFKNVECASIFEADHKYDVVIWMNTKYGYFGFPDERIYVNDISDLLLLKPDGYHYAAEKNLLYKAISLTKGRFIILRDPAYLSPVIEELEISEI